MSYLGNNPSQQAFVPAVDYFNGTGSATAFTLSRPVASVAQVQVTIENVPQNPSSSFTVSGSTITFTSAPPSGTSNIYVQYTSPITQVIAPGQGTVTATSMASSTGTGAGVFATSPTLTTPVINGFTGDTSVINIGSGQVYKAANGYVGIGTSSPLRSLSINGGGFTFQEVGGSNRTIHWGDEATNIFPVTIIGSSTSGSEYLAFNTNIFGNAAAERMRIDSSGHDNGYC